LHNDASPGDFQKAKWDILIAEEVEAVAVAVVVAGPVRYLPSGVASGHSGQRVEVQWWDSCQVKHS
jgi:hypothetical protein